MSHQQSTSLPQEQSKQIREASELEWITIGYMTFTDTLAVLVSGNLLPLRTAWVEGILPVLP